MMVGGGGSFPFVQVAFNRERERERERDYMFTPPHTYSANPLLFKGRRRDRERVHDRGILHINVNIREPYNFDLKKMSFGLD